MQVSHRVVPGMLFLRSLETNQEILLDRSEISIKKKKWSIKQRKNNASQ